MSAQGVEMTTDNFNAHLQSIVIEKMDRNEQLSPVEEKIMMKVIDEGKKIKVEEKKIEAFQKVNADVQKLVQEGQKVARMVWHATLEKIDGVGPHCKLTIQNCPTGPAQKKPAAGPTKKEPAKKSEKGRRARKENGIVGKAPVISILDDMDGMEEVGQIITRCCILESKYPFAPQDKMMAQLDYFVLQGGASSH